MNEHILLVMIWINKPELVTKKELWDNRWRSATREPFAAYKVAATAYAIKDAGGSCGDAEDVLQEYFNKTKDSRDQYNKEVSIRCKKRALIAL